MRKTVHAIWIGTIGLIIVALAWRTLTNSRYSSKIPELAAASTLSEPVQEQISEALKNARRRPSPDNLGMLGMVYHSSANYEQAEECYKLAIMREGSAWIWNYYLGYLNTEMGESDAVIENFNRVIEINPDINLAWYYSGEEYKNRREYDLAEKYFSKIAAVKKSNTGGKNSTRTDHFPLGTYAKFQLSRIYFDTGRLDLAEKTLKEIIQANRTFGPAYRLIGNIYSMKGDMPLSKQYGVRANDLMIYTPPVDTLIDRLVLMSKSELYLLKKIDEAVNSIHSEWALRLIKNGLKYLPENKYLVSKAIKTSLWMDLNDQAIAYADRHISLSLNDFNELYNTGMSFFQKELYPESLKYLTRALELNPGDLDIQKRLAICLWHMGEMQKSYYIFDQIIEKNPDNLDVLADVADILFFDLEERDRAIGYLTLLEHFRPSNPKVQKMAAWMDANNEKIPEAIDLYESSFKSAPEDLTTIKNLGTLLIEQKMWKKSISHYREALEYHPNEAYFLERLGTLLVTCPDTSLRNIMEGREYSERAFIHTTGRSLITISAGRSLALAYSMLGDKHNASAIINLTINVARRAKFSPANMEVLENLSRQIQQMDM